MSLAAVTSPQSPLPSTTSHAGHASDPSPNQPVLPGQTPHHGGVTHHGDQAARRALGKEIARVATSDPGEARFQLKKAMSQTSDPAERREIARGLTGALSHEELKAIGGSQNGRALLELARGAMPSDDTARGDVMSRTRIDSALTAVDLKQSPGFGALDRASQQQALESLARGQGQPGVAENIAALTKSAGFQTASPATRSQLLAAQAQHGNDPAFRVGLEKLAADPQFAKLTAPQQSQAIASFSAFAHRESQPAGQQAAFDNARKLVLSPGFREAGAPSRDAALKALGNHAADGAYTGRLLKLIDSPGFAALQGTGKAVDLLKAYGNDNGFAKGVDALGGQPRFSALDGPGQARVIGDMLRLSKTSSYAQASPTDRQSMVEILGDASAFSAAHPGNLAVRNTVDALVNGSVKLSLFQKAPQGNHLSLGQWDGQRMRLNSHPETKQFSGPPLNLYIDILVHEVNHQLSGPTAGGTPDRFLDEYQAGLVGEEGARGRPSTPAEQLEWLNNLVDGSNPAYDHLATLYNTNPAFKRVVDDMKRRLEGSTDQKTGVVTPPAHVSPDQARKSLLAAGFRSPYLTRPANTDNHR